MDCQVESRLLKLDELELVDETDDMMHLFYLLFEGTPLGGRPLSLLIGPYLLTIILAILCSLLFEEGQ